MADALPTPRRKPAPKPKHRTEVKFIHAQHIPEGEQLVVETDEPHTVQVFAAGRSGPDTLATYAIIRHA